MFSVYFLLNKKYVKDFVRVFYMVLFKLLRYELVLTEVFKLFHCLIISVTNDFFLINSSSLHFGIVWSTVL